MNDMTTIRLRNALEAVLEWVSDDGDMKDELYNQGIIEYGDMPNWSQEWDFDE